jgi:hypothetical protein
MSWINYLLEIVIKSLFFMGIHKEINIRSDGSEFGMKLYKDITIDNHMSSICT